MSSLRSARRWGLKDLQAPLQRVRRALRDRGAVEPRSLLAPTLLDHAREAELDQYGFTVVRGVSGPALDALKSMQAGHGAAPDDPKIALNWTFHSQSADHKQAVQTELTALMDGFLTSTFVDHTPFLATYITKWPGPNSGFAPHQDPSLVDERFFRGVTVWMPLVDTGLEDVDNGMLRMVPGSHRFSSVLRASDVDVFQFAEHEEQIVERYGVGVGMAAGEALIFDNRVIHYSMPNQTDVARTVVSFGMRPSVAACVLLRSKGNAMMDMYQISDSFYIDVLPAQQHAWQPTWAPVATVESRPERATSEEFDRWCRAVQGRPASVRSYAGASPSWRDPEAFCAVCGSIATLSEDDRSGRNNAQLVCEPCRGRIVAP